MKVSHPKIKSEPKPSKRTNCAGIGCKNYKPCNPFGSREYCDTGSGLDWIDEKTECASYERR